MTYKDIFTIIAAMKNIFTIFAVAVCAALSSGCRQDSARADRNEIRTQAYQYAKSLEKDGNGAEAIKKYQEMIDKDPGAALAHLELGILLHDLDLDFPRAIYHYRRCLELRPDAEKVQIVVDRIKQAEEMMVRRVIEKHKPAPEAQAPDPAAGEAKKALLDMISAKDTEIAELRKANIELVRKADALQIKYDALSDTVEPEKPAGVKPPPAVVYKPEENRPVPPAETPGSAAGPQKTMRTYVVKKEDTLSLIAMKVYKDGELWPKIYEANKDAIPDKNRLQPGQVLIVP